MKKIFTKTGLFLAAILFAGNMNAQSQYQCGGTNILSEVSFTLGTTYFAPGWAASTNFTATWDTGTLTLHLGAATYEAWQAQFPIMCAPQTLVADKTYFISFDVTTNVALPRVYLKVQASGANDNYIDLPSQSVPAGTTTVSGICKNAGGTVLAKFDEIGFDLGSNPANANVTISNITICDDFIGDVQELPVPTIAAPRPTVPAENVMSIYGSAYTPAATYQIGSWGQTTATSTVVLEGINTLKMERFNYLGFELNNGSGANTPIDCTGMEKLHIDVWTPNGTSFQITPISVGPKEKLFTCTPLNLEAWNSFDIPLTNFTDVVDLVNIFQIKVVGAAAVQTESTAYVDNIYFYKEDTSGINPTFADQEAINTQYFTIDGRQVSNPVFGLYIVKKTYKDNSVKVEKVFVK